MRLFQWTLLVAGSFLLLYFGIVPAFSRIDSDFPNYYTSARLVIEGGNLTNLYDDAWFQKQIEREGIVSGLRRATVRVEKRLDGSLAVRYGERYLAMKPCAPAEKKAPTPAQVEPTGKRRQTRRGSDWNKNFDLKKGPKIWQAAQASGRGPRESE